MRDTVSTPKPPRRDAAPRNPHGSRSEGSPEVYPFPNSTTNFQQGIAVSHQVFFFPTRFPRHFHEPEVMAHAQPVQHPAHWTIGRPNRSEGLPWLGGTPKAKGVRLKALHIALPRPPPNPQTRDEGAKKLLAQLTSLQKETSPAAPSCGSDVLGF